MCLDFRPKTLGRPTRQEIKPYFWCYFVKKTFRFILLAKKDNFMLLNGCSMLTLSGTLIALDNHVTSYITNPVKCRALIMLGFSIGLNNKAQITTG